jgi:hypothetical protein
LNGEPDPGSWIHPSRTESILIGETTPRHIHKGQADKGWSGLWECY